MREITSDERFSIYLNRLGFDDGVYWDFSEQSSVSSDGLGVVDGSLQIRNSTDMEAGEIYDIDVSVNCLCPWQGWIMAGTDSGEVWALDAETYEKDWSYEIFDNTIIDMDILQGSNLVVADEDSIAILEAVDGGLQNIHQQECDAGIYSFVCDGYIFVMGKDDVVRTMDSRLTVADTVELDKAIPGVGIFRDKIFGIDYSGNVVVFKDGVNIVERTIDVSSRPLKDFTVHNANLYVSSQRGNVFWMNCDWEVTDMENVSTVAVTHLQSVADSVIAVDKYGHIFELREGNVKNRIKPTDHRKKAVCASDNNVIFSDFGQTLIEVSPALPYAHGGTIRNSDEWDCDYIVAGYEGNISDVDANVFFGGRTIELEHLTKNVHEVNSSDGFLFDFKRDTGNMNLNSLAVYIK